MSTVTVTLGFTQSDRATGYSSFDGYRPGARQEEVAVEIPTAEAYWRTAAEIAEQAFEATNAPYDVTGLAATFREALYGPGKPSLRALSVGDTVTVARCADGLHTRVACDRVGWVRL